jgi:hypothetical protein
MRSFLFFTLFFLAGCQTAAVAPLPAYSDLVARHNDRVKNIERFWARAVIEVRWADVEGKSRFEQGDGHLILDLPNHSALNIGKLGQVKLWAGSNDTHYWLFDELDDRKLYLGRHDGIEDDTPGARQPSPLPLRPVDLPRLLGILPIEPAPGTQAVREVDGMYVIEPPGSRTRYHIHPIYKRVVQVDLLDTKGKAILTSRLGNPLKPEAERMEDENGYPSGPFIDNRFEVTTPGREGSMILFLFGVTDAKRRINPNVFNLERLIKTEFKPQRIVPIESP